MSTNTNQNPILQGIALSQQYEALGSLLSAVATSGAPPEDMHPLVTKLQEQINRVNAELSALVNLYGGIPAEKKEAAHAS